MHIDALIPLLILIGFMISLYGSIVGFGGGIFMVPILVTVFNYPLDIAAGTAMISLVPSSLISTYLNRKKGNVDFKMGIILEIPTMVGVVLGSFILTYFAAKGNLIVLEIIFALMILIIGVSFFLEKKNKDENQGFFYKLNKVKPRFVIKNSLKMVAYRVSLLMALFFGLMAGALAGLFGVGGGFMKTPIMLKVFKIPAKIAAGTALFMIIITSVTGSIMHTLQGHILLDKSWSVALGFSLGAIAGYKLNTKLKDKFLEKLIGVSLITAACMMFFKFVVMG